MTAGQRIVDADALGDNGFSFAEFRRRNKAFHAIVQRHKDAAGRDAGNGAGVGLAQMCRHILGLVAVLHVTLNALGVHFLTAGLLAGAGGKVLIFRGQFLRALAQQHIAALINKKMISKKGFKKKENGAVLMDDETRKVVLVEWQNKKKETLTHPFLKEKVEWGMVPYVQAMLLARYLRGDLDAYPPFLWK